MAQQDLQDYLDDRLDDAQADQGYAFDDDALQAADDDFDFYSDLYDQLFGDHA